MSRSLDLTGLEGKRGEESQVALVARTMLIGAEATVDSCMVADGLVARSPQGGQNVIHITKFHSSLLFTLDAGRIPDRNNVKEEGLVLSHGLRGHSPTWWERHSDSLDL